MSLHRKAIRIRAYEAWPSPARVAKKASDMTAACPYTDKLVEVGASSQRGEVTACGRCDYLHVIAKVNPPVLAGWFERI